MQREWRMQELAQVGHPGQSRELQEYLVDVFANGFIGGQ